MSELKLRPPKEYLCDEFSNLAPAHIGSLGRIQKFTERMNSAPFDLWRRAPLT
jgi:hypothetical protein